VWGAGKIEFPAMYGDLAGWVWRRNLIADGCFDAAVKLSVAQRQKQQLTRPNRTEPASAGSSKRCFPKGQSTAPVEFRSSVHSWKIPEIKTHQH
jgi:hypothetical protein